jgi:acyl-CoA synthetase (AMP-forming)/AMP-acid ligase II
VTVQDLARSPRAVHFILGALLRTSTPPDALCAHQLRELCDDDVFAYLFKAAYLTPQKPAVVRSAEPHKPPLTYEQMLDRTLRLASFFKQRGMAPGSRVAALLQNGVEVLDVHFAAAAARTVVVNLNTHLAAPELVYVVEEAAPTMLVVDNQMAGLLWVAYSVFADAPCPIRSMLWVGGIPDEAMALESRFGIVSFDYDVVVSSSAAGGHERLLLCDLPARDASDPFQIYFTSGTTGRPKAVSLTHKVSTILLVCDRTAVCRTDCPTMAHADCGSARARRCARDASACP